MNRKQHLKENFIPHPLVRGGSLQTIIANLISHQAAPKTKPYPVKLRDGDQLNLFIDPPRATDLSGSEANKQGFAKDAKGSRVLLMHGLGGCCESKYILRIGHKLTGLGYEVIRFNHRGCGPGGQRLARQIYHGARTDDLEDTIKAIHSDLPPKKLLVVAFSLSANVVLKYLGSSPNKSQEPATKVERAMCVVPPIDLETCSLAMAKFKNFWINYYFGRRLFKTAKTRSEVFDLPFELKKIISVREFDEVYTAPEGGFASRLDYYNISSSKEVLKDIETQTKILVASDDPIVPIEDFNGIALSDKILFESQRYGGHMGFVSRYKTELGDHFWMDSEVVKWVSGKEDQESTST